MLASDVRLVPITEEQREKASLKDMCRQILENGETSDPYNLQGTPVSTLSSECLKLDMSDGKDREVYADLAARAVASPEDVVLLWEERVKCVDGGLIIYLCYVEKRQIASNSLKG